MKFFDDMTGEQKLFALFWICGAATASVIAVCVAAYHIACALYPRGLGG